MNHQNYLYLEYRRALRKFRKLQTRFDKRIAKNTLQELTARKRYRLVAALRKLQQKIEQLASRLKLATAAGATVAVVGLGTPVDASSSNSKVLAARSIPAAPKTLSVNRTLVNDETVGSQENASASMNKDGDYVIVWQDANNQIQGKVYDADDSSTSITVTNNTLSNSDPSVSINDDGDIVVVWETMEATTGYSTFGLQYIRFDADDNYSSDGPHDLAVGTDTEYKTFDDTDVALNNDGDFAVVWESYSQGVGNSDVFGKYVSADNTQSSELPISENTTYNQIDPAVDIDDDGNFYVVWGDSDDYYGATQFSLLTSRKYNKETPESGESRIYQNGLSSNLVRNPEVAMNLDGTVAMVFEYNDGSGNGSIRSKVIQGSGGEDLDFSVESWSGGNNASDPQIAMDKDGGFVIAYDYSYSLFEYISAKRYTRFGSLVASQSIFDSGGETDPENPTIAMSDRGDYIIAWDDDEYDGNTCDEDEDCDGRAVYYKKFSDPANEPYCKTDQELVNSTEPGTQESPAADQNANGDYVVVWSGAGNAVDENTGIFGQRYNSDGQKVDGEFHINTTTEDNQTDPDVAIADDGSFVVVWRTRDFSTSQYGIYAQKFDNAGSESGTEFIIDQATGISNRLYDPAIDINASGEFVVTWAHNNEAIYAREYTGPNTPVAAEFQVNTYNAGDYYRPDVVLRDDGSFVIAWGSNATSDSAPGNHFIFTRRYDTEGSPFATEQASNSGHSGEQNGMDMVLDDRNGDFIITWSESSSPYYDVKISKFDSNGAISDGINEQLISDHGWDGGQQSVDVDSDGNIAVAFTAYNDSGDKTTYVSTFDSDGDAIYENADVGGEYGPNVMFDKDSDPRVIYSAQGDGTDIFHKTMIGPFPGRIDASNEFIVNTKTEYDQSTSDVSKNADGDFVVVWKDSYGYSGYQTKSIRAQRYNADGERVGAEIEVNNNSSYHVDNPAVALDDNGNFMVVWSAQGHTSGGGYTSVNGSDGDDIYASVFDSDGNEVLDDSRINTEIVGNQRYPDIALDQSGNFQVIWSDHYNGDYEFFGVRSQKFNSGGETVGSTEDLVTHDPDTYSSAQHVKPTIAINGDGDAAIAYVIPNSNNYLNLKIFQSSGAVFLDGDMTIGGEYTADRQPDIAADDNGDFIVVWTEYDPGTKYYDVKTRKYSKTTEGDGDLGSTSILIKPDDGSATQPQIVSVDDGDFVVTYDYNNGIYGQRFDNAFDEVGPQIQVNDYTTNTQSNSAISTCPNGSFVVTWESDDHDGFASAVMAKNFVSVKPVLDSNDGLTIDEGDTGVTLDGPIAISNLSGASGYINVTTFPTNGTLLLNGLEFSEDDMIAAGDLANLTYDHDGNENTSDSFDFVLSNEQYSTQTHTFDITINPVNDAPVFEKNNDSNVTEGERVDLNGLLEFSDPDHTTDQIKYVLETLPTYGSVVHDSGSGVTTFGVGSEFNQADVASGTIYYQNDGSHQSSDSFNFEVTDGVTSAGSFTHSTSISLVNDDPVQVNNANSAVNEGESVTISNSNIQYTDEESDASQLSFEMTSAPGQGTLKLDGSDLNVGDTFTQDDINNNRLTYEQDGSDPLGGSGSSADSMDFSITQDGSSSTSDALTFEIDVTYSDDEPIVHTNDGGQLDEGSSLVVRSTLLDISDEEDSDTELQIVVDVLPTHGTLTVEGTPLTAGGQFSNQDLIDNKVSYNNDGSESTSDSFEFTILDKNAGYGGNIFDFTINPINDTPVITTNSIMGISEGNEAPLGTDLLTVDDDDHSDIHLTFTLTTIPQHGNLKKSGADLGELDTFTQEDINNELITYAHDGSEASSTDSFDFVVEDDLASSTNATFNFSISFTNDAPISNEFLNDQIFTEDVAFSYTFSEFAFTDEESALTYTATQSDDTALPSWITFDALSRTFSGTPLNGDLGFTAKVTASDGLLEVSDEFDIAVNPVNDAPSIANSVANQSATEDIAFSFTFTEDTFEDIDGDELTYSARITGESYGVLPDWLTFDGLTRTFSGMPLEGDESVSIDLIASDGQIEIQDQFMINITPVNDPPTVANAISDQSATEDEAFSFTVPSNTFEDVDNASLTLTANQSDDSALPAWLSFDGSAFSGTPLEGDGAVTVKVTASDGLLSVSDEFTINVTAVNDAPTVANAISDQSATEDEAFSFTVPSNTFEDVDNASLTLTATQSDDSVLPDWLSFDGSAFSGTPLEGDGDVTVKVTASDGLLSVSDEFSITVTPVNDAPTVTNAISDQSATEDVAFSFTVPSNTFEDVDDASLTLTATQSDDSALPVWLSFDGSAFSGTPLEGDGDVTVKVTASDGLLSVSDEFTINVTAVNDAPTVANAISDQSATEDEAFSFTVPANTFEDVENASLTLTATQSDDSALPGWLSFDGSAFSGTPLEGDGDVTVKVTASDGSLTVSDEFVITVTPVNDGPTLANPLENQSTDLFQPYSFIVPSNTFFDEESDEVTLSASLDNDSTLPSWLSFDATTGTLSGTPDQFFGTLDIKITGTTPDGEFASSTFTLTVNYVLTEENDLKVNIEMYPNPVKDILNLQIENEGLGDYEFMIFDKTGRIVKQSTFVKMSSKQLFEINVSDLQSGLYIIRIAKDKTTATFKINKI